MAIPPNPDSIITVDRWFTDARAGTKRVTVAPRCGWVWFRWLRRSWELNAIFWRASIPHAKLRANAHTRSRMNATEARSLFWAAPTLNPHPLKAEGAAPKINFVLRRWSMGWNLNPAIWGTIAATGRRR